MRRANYFAMALAASAIPCFAQDATAGGKPPPDTLYAHIPDLFAALLVVAFIVAAVVLRNAISGSKWSLADALSEEAEVTLLGADGEPVLDGGKPVTVTEMRASVSRFIAIFGLIAILTLYFGVGIVLVRRLAADEPLPSKDQFDQLETFFFAGLTLFAPYIANKFSSIFDWLKPPRRG